MEMLHEYQVSQQVLDIKKFVKVCLHSSLAVQIPLQFDEFFDKNSNLTHPVFTQRNQR